LTSWAVASCLRGAGGSPSWRDAAPLALPLASERSKPVTRFCEQAGLQLEPFQKRIAKAYAPKTIHALLSLATKSVKVWQQTVLRLS
jgi:hypothetical protein